ncbi:MAG: response regulator [Candidatus Omnitrophica bacterium]|nr:response regulator [Candidatus Omnitrophota bacterium]
MDATQKKRILIIEDEEEMRKIYASMFESELDKYDVEFTSDARLAYKKLEKQRCDLIILDIIMEPMDGEVFFACLRAKASLNNIPVLVVSVVTPDKLSIYAGSGYLSYLRKPINKDQLFNKIHKLLA